MNPDTKGVDNSSSKLAFGFGATGDIKMADNIYFSTGLGGYFNGGGLKYNDIVVKVEEQENDTIMTRESDYNLKYIKIPLTFKGKTNEIGYMTYFVEFGGSLGINYRARQDINAPLSTGSSEIDTKDLDVSDKTNFLRLSMIISGGFEYNLSGNTSVLVAATFDNGLTNVFNKNDVTTYQADENGKPKKENGDLVGGPDLESVANTISLRVGILF